MLTPTEMMTVVGNLVDNALDACDKDDPWVEVTVQQDDVGPADRRGRQWAGHGRGDV